MDKYGNLTPDQWDRYCQALDRLPLDRWPDRLAVMETVMGTASSPARHAAVKAWLDTALGGAP